MGSSLVNMGEHIGYEPEETPPTQVHASWELTYSGDWYRFLRCESARQQGNSSSIAGHLGFCGSGAASSWALPCFFQNFVARLRKRRWVLKNHWNLGKKYGRPSGKHTKNYGKSPFGIGKSTVNEPFSIAKLNYQRVPYMPQRMAWSKFMQSKTKNWINKGKFDGCNPFICIMENGKSRTVQQVFPYSKSICWIIKRSLGGWLRIEGTKLLATMGAKNGASMDVLNFNYTFWYPKNGCYTKHDIYIYIYIIWYII